MAGAEGYPSLSSSPSHSASLESECERRRPEGLAFGFDFRVDSEFALGFGFDLGFERRSVFESSKESYPSSRAENLGLLP